MFRRQTDEVFTTLQQVQRRLSQHTEAGTPDAVVSSSVRRVSRPGDPPRSNPDGTPSSTAAKGRPPPRSTPPPARASQYGSKFRINDSGSEQPQHVVPVVDRSRIGRTAAELPTADHIAEPHIAVRPRGLLLTPALTLMLAVLFVASVVGAYALGSSGQQPAGGGLGPAPGEAGSRDAQTIAQQREQQREQSTTRTTANVPIPGTTARSTPAVQPRGDHVLVLESLPRYSAQSAERFQAVADRYNEMARQYAADGYQPWFGVRRPSSGGLQLVFGALADDVFGVPDNDDLARKMFTEMRSSRFPTAFWVKIR